MPEPEQPEEQVRLITGASMGSRAAGLWFSLLQEHARQAALCDGPGLFRALWLASHGREAEPPREDRARRFFESYFLHKGEIDPDAATLLRAAVRQQEDEWVVVAPFAGAGGAPDKAALAAGEPLHRVRSSSYLDQALDEDLDACREARLTDGTGVSYAVARDVLFYLMLGLQKEQDEQTILDLWRFARGDRVPESLADGFVVLGFVDPETRRLNPGVRNLVLSAVRFDQADRVVLVSPFADEQDHADYARHCVDNDLAALTAASDALRPSPSGPRGGGSGSGRDGRPGRHR